MNRYWQLKHFSKILFVSIIFFICTNVGYAQYFSKEKAIQYVKDNNRSLDTDTLLSIVYYEEMGNFSLALSLCDVIEERAKANDDLTNLYKSFRNKGMIYEKYQKEDSALVFHQAALDIAHQIKGKEGQMRQKMSILDLAYTYSSQMEYAKAFEWFQKNLDLAFEQDDDEYKIYSYYGMSAIHMNVYDYEKAVETYLKVLELGYKQEDYVGIVLTLSDMADIYTKMGHFNLALDAFAEAKQVLDKTKKLERNKLKGTYNASFGKFYMKQKEYEKAKSYYEKAIDLFKLSNAPHETVTSYLRTGEAALLLNQPELALEYLTLTEKGKEYLYEHEIAEFYYILGNTLLAIGKDDEASDAYNQSLQISLDNDIKEIAQKSYLGLYLYNKSQRNYKAALDFFIQHTSLDSIFNNENLNKAVAEMEYKYDLSNKEREIVQLEQKNQRTLLIALITFLVFAMLILVYLYRVRVKRNALLKKKNEEIQQQYRQLKESHHALEQFAFVAAHDLKEPLRTIGGYSSLLKRRLDNISKETQLEYLNFMSDASTRLSTLLDDLLFYSNISKEPPGNDISSLETLIHEAIYRIKNDVNESKANINLAEFNDFKIKATSNHIQLLFKELISNAIKFNNQIPQIYISLKKEADTFSIHVKDNGIGLDENYKNKVFNIFNRLDKQSDYQGTGIGLTLSKNIVEKYNGTIDYTSIKNDGTTFIISFPNTLIAK